MAIKIVYYSEVIDNWGRRESSAKALVIYSVLTNPEAWSDDMAFEDESGRVYFLDDLVGQEVELEGMSPFIVTED